MWAWRLPAAPARRRFVLGGLEAYVGHRTRVQPDASLPYCPVLQSMAAQAGAHPIYSRRALIGLVASRISDRSDDVLGGSRRISELLVSHCTLARFVRSKKKNA